MPSYNESANIKTLVFNIRKFLQDSEIVIVDDSRKEENDKIKKILKNKKNIILISREKKGGRGSAIMDGFKEALKDKAIKYIFEMDSDLAHDPKEFSRFIKKKEYNKYDLIIGSRYLPGGRIINIPPNRTIMSRVINKFLFYWLGMHLSDHTSGFRLYSRKAVEYLIRTKLKSKGFIALSESAYKLFLAGYKITEVPITWNYRRFGKSNVNLKELSKSMFFVIYLRLEALFK